MGLEIYLLNMVNLFFRLLLKEIQIPQYYVQDVSLFLHLYVEMITFLYKYANIECVR